MVGKICDCSLGGRFSTDDMLKLLNADFPVSRLMIISVGASQWRRSFRKFLPAKFSFVWRTDAFQQAIAAQSGLPAVMRMSRLN